MAAHAATIKEAMMRIGQATGFQVVFLMFAVMLLAVPLSGFVVNLGVTSHPWRGLVEQGTQFVLAIAVILAFPNLRRFAIAELAKPVPPSRRIEVASVSIAKVAMGFAAPGVLALWVWGHDGLAGLATLHADPVAEQARATSDAGLVRLLLAVLIAPIVEEVVCRGFIYRAFERQWGWIASMVLTSIVFGIYHKHFWAAFAASLVYVCLLRRTGTLRAPILAHMLFNLMLWWPLLGRYVFPGPADAGDPDAWSFHIACALFVAIALPAYLWMSRDAALQK